MAEEKDIAVFIGKLDALTAKVIEAGGNQRKRGFETGLASDYFGR
jgi:hypothetical protein